MTVYFGSDWHLDHTKVIELCNRPFSSIEDMANSFFDEWEDKVKPGDRVYLLGDILFKRHDSYLQRFKELPGDKFLIRGNHDHKSLYNAEHIWIKSKQYLELKIDGQDIVLMHYPIEDWNKKRHGSFHLHGHTHNNISHEVSFIPNRIDIGYDSVGSALISYEQIAQIIRSTKLNGYLKGYINESTA